MKVPFWALLLLGTGWLSGCVGGQVAIPEAGTDTVSQPPQVPGAMGTVDVATATHTAVERANLQAAEAASAARLRRARLEAAFLPTKSLEERQQEVRRELAAKRNDPFRQLPGTVVVVSPPRPVLPPAPPSPPPVPRARPAPPPVRSGAPPVRPQPLPAANLKVTGVVDMGADIYAIVSVPGDVTSQYVRGGQRLASGIYVQEVFAGAEPGIVVWQNGRRFVRYVN